MWSQQPERCENWNWISSLWLCEVPTWSQYGEYSCCVMFLCYVPRLRGFHNQPRINKTALLSVLENRLSCRGYLLSRFFMKMHVLYAHILISFTDFICSAVASVFSSSLFWEVSGFSCLLYACFYLCVPLLIMWLLLTSLSLRLSLLYCCPSIYLISNRLMY